MILIDTVEGLVKSTEAARAGGRRVGLVPTMGSLHAGHLSLVGRARRDNDTVVVTVFVNPLQFGPDEDLAAYPRDPQGDVARAGEAGADLVFLPGDDEMYPRPPVTSVRVAGLSEPLEGRSRPGHLEGVATVVAKLFAMAGACRAYFGEKDYQQLCVVRRLAADLSFPVEVVGCPTVRDGDGLALSSRNARLSPAERAAAPVVHRALVAGRREVLAGQRDPAVVAQVMARVVSAEPSAHLDYAVAADPDDLRTPSRLAGEVRLLAAAWIGDVRLIDNLAVLPPAAGHRPQGHSHLERQPCDGA